MLEKSLREVKNLIQKLREMVPGTEVTEEPVKAPYWKSAKKKLEDREEQLKKQFRKATGN